MASRNRVRSAPKKRCARLKAVANVLLSAVLAFSLLAGMAGCGNSNQAKVTKVVFVPAEQAASLGLSFTPAVGDNTSGFKGALVIVFSYQGEEYAVNPVDMFALPDNSEFALSDGYEFRHWSIHPSINLSSLSPTVTEQFGECYEIPSSYQVSVNVTFGFGQYRYIYPLKIGNTFDAKILGGELRLVLDDQYLK